MWQRTRADDMAEQQSARRLRLVLGALLGIAGLALAIALVAGLWTSGTWMSVVPVPVLILGGLLLIRDGWSIRPTPNPTLPTIADLPANDPRRALQTSQRRSLWLAAAALSVAGPLLAAAGTWATRDTLPSWVRLVGFLTLSYGSVGLGRLLFSKRLGSAEWPKSPPPA
jgi:protein-S-isoprenylcysteine O-methyltransferase Ste14